MAFSLHYHFLCRIGRRDRELGRVLRTLNRPQMYATWLGCSSRAVFSSVLSLVAFWQKRSRDQPETPPDRGTDQQNRRSTAELEQHYTAGHVCLRGNLPNICCLLKQNLMLNRPQASRHCQETLSKGSWHEPRVARLTHTLSLFCFCGLVSSKMSHRVNKSCITQHVVAQGGYASEVARNSQNTAGRCRKKLCIFFSWISHCMLAVGALDWLETWTWCPRLVNFRLDVLIVVFSRSDSFSRIWSHGERDRERGGGGGGRSSEIEQNLLLAWTSLPVACPTICMQRRDKRDSNVSWSASQRRVTKLTVAYWPAVSIRLSRSLGFPTCLFLASPLSGPHERRPMASRATFLLVFRCLNHTAISRKAFNGVQKGQVHSKKHKPSKKYFCGRLTPGSPPADLNSHCVSLGWASFAIFQKIKCPVKLRGAVANYRHFVSNEQCSFELNPPPPPLLQTNTYFICIWKNADQEMQVLSTWCSTHGGV